MQHRQFDPADFDRRLDALVAIAESQSNSVHEIGETLRRQGASLQESIKENYERNARQLAELRDFVMSQAENIHDLMNVTTAQGHSIVELKESTRELKEAAIEQGRNIDRIIDAVLRLSDDRDALDRRMALIEQRRPGGPAPAAPAP